MLDASTVSSSRLFQRPTTLCEKTNFLLSLIHPGFSNLVDGSECFKRTRGAGVYADDVQWLPSMPGSVASVTLCVCVRVRALKGKRLELSTPNLVHIYYCLGF